MLAAVDPASGPRSAPTTASCVPGPAARSDGRHLGRPRNRAGSRRRVPLGTPSSTHVFARWPDGLRLVRVRRGVGTACGCARRVGQAQSEGSDRDRACVNAPPSFEPQIEGASTASPVKRRPADVEADFEFSLAFVDHAEGGGRPGQGGGARRPRCDAVVWFAYPKGSSKKYTCEFRPRHRLSTARRRRLRAGAHGGHRRRLDRHAGAPRRVHQEPDASGELRALERGQEAYGAPLTREVPDGRQLMSLCCVASTSAPPSAWRWRICAPS